MVGEGEEELWENEDWGDFVNKEVEKFWWMVYDYVECDIVGIGFVVCIDMLCIVFVWWWVGWVWMGLV